MAQVPYSTTGGYQPGPINPDGVPLVDEVDAVDVLIPSFAPGGIGALQPNVFDPKTVSDVAGTPADNAILVELRVITNLLLLQLGANAPDIEQMRADELWNTTISTGTI